jgi:clavulanate-9-aldehyde reducatase
MSAVQGARVLVSGASSGIGEAIAVALAEAGAHVHAGGRRMDRLRTLSRASATEGHVIHPIELDVTDAAACGRVVSEVEDGGGLDILVNNAGLMLLGPVDAERRADWDRMIDTNLRGLLSLTAAVLPAMRARGAGHIVMMSSVAGRVPAAGNAVYNATKAAVNAFSEALRQELVGTGVRVTVIAPGATATEVNSHITHEASREESTARFGAMRLIQPRDVADAVLYALSTPPSIAVSEVVIRSVDQLR